MATSSNHPNLRRLAPVSPTVPVTRTLRSYPWPFWAAQIMEAIERLAYYGVRVVVPIYIASTEDPFGLGFTGAQKGQIFAQWALVQTLLPMFTGGLADRYGRRKTIGASIVLKVVGYVLMATQRTYPGFLAGCLVLAAGTALFKPGAWGTVAANVREENATVGWAIFYWVVNVGGFLGPPLAGALRAFSWPAVFFTCGAAVSLNLLVLLTYSEEKSENAVAVGSLVVQSVTKLFTRPRLLGFIAVSSGYYVMFMQLFDAMPNFIEEWVDSTDIVAALGLTAGPLARLTPRGLQVPQEWMINVDAGTVLLFILPLSFLIARAPRLRVFVVGVFLTALGLLVAGTADRGAFCLLGIVVFAVGEMIAGPKVTEHLSLAAPKGEEALYMGYANVPIAVGWASGAYVAGLLYERWADKANLAVRYLREREGLVEPLARAQAFARLQEVTHTSAKEATAILWQAYHPYVFWYGFVAVGLTSALGVVIFERWTGSKLSVSRASP